MFNILQKRAEMLKATRDFFEQRGVLEVDCPHLLEYPQIDAHIEVMEVPECGYLHTSPEYMMKKLLAKGSGDIYQIAHVFRKGEKGENHHPEFTMIEWYRVGFTLEELIEETVDLMRLFFGPIPYETRSYFDEWKKHVPYENAPKELLFSKYVEPELGVDQLTVLNDFPENDAGLSRVEEGAAKRFEIFYRGKELANGYFELTCPEEHRKRFDEQNALRTKEGKPAYPLDESFLKVLPELPESCGVSVGFDRLLMLQLGEEKVTNVQCHF